MKNAKNAKNTNAINAITSVATSGAAASGKTALRRAPMTASRTASRRALSTAPLPTPLLSTPLLSTPLLSTALALPALSPTFLIISVISVLSVFLIILAPAVSAGLQVTAFTCNSQSGTITVENQGTLNCDATIQNTGSSSETMTTISLVTDGTWAEQTSYGGSGFTSPLSAGASTTASFTGIVPTTSGVHAFSYVRIDSTTDSKPSESQINAISVKTLSISAASVKTLGQAFSVSASITSGGNLDAVYANLTILNSECVLNGNLKAQKNSLGSLLSNAVGSTSWTVIQGNDTCKFNVTAEGATSGITVYMVKNATVSNASSSGVQSNDENLSKFLVNLTPGWNIFSIPLNLTNSSVSSALASLDTSYTYVWGYNGSWQYNLRGSGGTLTDLEPERGYWVFINGSSVKILNISGNNLTNLATPLTTSYTLVGYKSNVTKTMAQAFSGFTPRYYIWAYSSGAWTWHDSGGLSFLNTLSRLTSGRGYYIAAGSAANWTAGYT